MPPSLDLCKHVLSQSVWASETSSLAPTKEGEKHEKPGGLPLLPGTIPLGLFRSVFTSWCPPIIRHPHLSDLGPPQHTATVQREKHLTDLLRPLSHHSLKRSGRTSAFWFTGCQATSWNVARPTISTGPPLKHCYAAKTRTGKVTRSSGIAVRSQYQPSVPVKFGELSMWRNGLYKHPFLQRCSMGWLAASPVLLLSTSTSSFRSIDFTAACGRDTEGVCAWSVSKAHDCSNTFHGAWAIFIVFALVHL